jgi:RimJ/RimL family protein N-acetyltransferase
MRVVVFSAPQPFLTRAEPLLKTDPFTTSVITTVTTRVASGAVPNKDENLWHTIEGAHGQVIGVAMHTPPYNMFLSRMPRDAVIALAHDVADRRRELPGVNGASESTAAFAKAWEAITGRSSRVDRAMRMYRLVDLVWPEAVLGEAVRAESTESGMVAEWFAEFHDEAQSDAPVDDWTAMAQRRIEAGDVHLWRAEDVPVALAAVSAAPAGVARVGPVYTPPSRRRNGYGSGVTAAATAAALGLGAQHVVLYTDLANPTSNSIYQAIGYRPDHDAEERSFQSPIQLRNNPPQLR